MKYNEKDNRISALVYQKYTNPILPIFPFILSYYLMHNPDKLPLYVNDDLTLEDVIEDHKVSGKSANWGRTYKNRTEKDRKELDTIKNNNAVERIYKKYHDKAAWSNDPLETFINDMFTELQNNNLTYSKSELKKRFLADFNDDFENDID